ncbi:uncharacterized protein KY384_002889 [Bacidia gigantensis]|uniref:uncharacterized protein n=1 Tax=Bacidia gigantensis TaxID=2732470 RepID=UPI001D03B2BD|nr:uncharacterized protein KY384_002889 [Bacidia gigantensis]KAG8532404.1 hypothetical protein KY384_002889 [Bacidia gigantensis]
MQDGAESNPLPTLPPARSRDEVLQAIMTFGDADGNRGGSARQGAVKVTEFAPPRMPGRYASAPPSQTPKDCMPVQPDAGSLGGESDHSHDRGHAVPGANGAGSRRAHPKPNRHVAQHRRGWLQLLQPIPPPSRLLAPFNLKLNIDYDVHARIFAQLNETPILPSLKTTRRAALHSLESLNTRLTLDLPCALKYYPGKAAEEEEGNLHLLPTILATKGMTKSAIHELEELRNSFKDLEPGYENAVNTSRIAYQQSLPFLPSFRRDAFYASFYKYAFRGYYAAQDAAVAMKQQWGRNMLEVFLIELEKLEKNALHPDTLSFGQSPEGLGTSMNTTVGSTNTAFSGFRSRLMSWVRGEDAMQDAEDPDVQAVREWLKGWYFRHVFEPAAPNTEMSRARAEKEWRDVQCGCLRGA